MAKQKTRRTELDSEESEALKENNEGKLEEIVFNLANSVAAMQVSIAKLTESMLSNQMNNSATECSKNVEASNVNKNNDRFYTTWREIGGSNLSFYPGGKMHPMLFIKKLNKLLGEAEVPGELKVRFSVNCLKGSALEWAENKEDMFDCFEKFVECFKDRYWGINDEKDLFYKIRYDKFKSGNRADYMLDLYKQASYLSEKIEEEKLIQWLVEHFSEDIRRGVLINGINNIDHFEKYLRRYDDGKQLNNNSNAGVRGNNDTRRVHWRAGNVVEQATANTESRTESNQNRGGIENTRDQNERGRRENREINREVRVLRQFFENKEDLLSDEETGGDNEVLLSPCIKIIIGHEVKEALLDSGSQISAISQNYFELLQEGG